MSKPPLRSLPAKGWAMAGRSGGWKRFGLQCYRLGIVVLIVWLVRDQHVRFQIEGDAPLSVEEIESFFPQAARLRADHTDRMGMHVINRSGEEVGYVLRTAPISNGIIGYAGPTDTLIAFDLNLKVLGIKIRKSEDTRTHLQDVINNEYFMNTWNGMDWDTVAEIDLEEAGIEGAAGATMTSRAIAQGISYRLKTANERLARRLPLSLGARDIGLGLVVAVGLIFAFTHLRGRRWFRRMFQVVVIGYVGLVNGDLIAQSLLVGWAKSGVGWRTAPGLALLVAAALMVPWVSRRPLYCLHLCPHGAAQEWLGRISKYRIRLRADLAKGMRWLPPLLLAAVLLTAMLVLPVDLADLEPFDAYVFRTAGWATLSIAIVGLLASLFVPQAYCKYGCPTGAFLEFLRSSGRSDRFGKRDVAAGLLAAMVAVLNWNSAAIQAWIAG